MEPLKIVVCTKAVPDPKKGSPSFDPVTKTVKRATGELVMNLLDKNALDEALKIRDKYGGEVTVVSMGPPEASPVLKESLALGADRAYLLSDRAFAGADTLATSKTLAQAIRQLGEYDLILCGAESSDGGTSQVGAQVAEILHIPFAAKAVEIQLSQRTARVWGKVEYGVREYEVHLPALLTVERELNTPKGVTMLGVIKSRGKEVTVLGAGDIGVTPEEVGASGSPTLIRDVEGPPPGRQGEVIEGDPEEAVRTLVEKLKARGVLA